MEIDLKDITKMGDEIERLTTEASELKETISILTQLNEQKTDDRYDDWAFSEDGYMRRGKALRVENERLQARVEALEGACRTMDKTQIAIALAATEQEDSDE